MNESKISKKFNKLKNILKNLKKIVVAYSGGVDSSFLLKIASDVLGRENVLAVIADSETYPEKELKEAKEFVKKHKINHLVIKTSELKNKNFSSNPKDRCYYCKKELFSKLREISLNNGFEYVVDGSNYDDLKDFRPGRKAIKELKVRSPLLEAKLTKSDIRTISKKLGLETWDKPSLACLASRFPYGIVINRKKLKTIEEAEKFLFQLGFKQVRVRYHNNIALIELLPEDIDLFISKDLRKKIINKFKKLGFKYITLDLQGYRSGSMNEVLR